MTFTFSRNLFRLSPDQITRLAISPPRYCRNSDGASATDATCEFDAEFRQEKDNRKKRGKRQLQATRTLAKPSAEVTISRDFDWKRTVTVSRSSGASSPMRSAYS
eukprot:2936381-Rhodomonas_salina.2